MASEKRIKGLDGIRGLAAVAVVLHHCWIGSRNIGGIAVDVFFVLSGFLICGILHSARLRIEDSQSGLRAELAHFWVNRGLRIMPLYYVALVLIAVAGMRLSLFRDVTHNFIWYAVYLQNFLMTFVTKQFGSVGHMWTLAVEQQFYVLFGALMLLVPARRHTALLSLALVTSFAGAIWAMAALPFPGKYILPLNGFVPILCGGLASLMSKNGPISHGSNSILRFCCCAIVACVALLPDSVNQVTYFVAGSLVVTAVVGSALMVEITRNQNGVVTEILDTPVLRWLGALSYGIYIIHGVARAVSQEYFHMYAGPLTFAAVLIVTLALAQVSRWLIELPALRMKYRQRGHLDQKQFAAVN